MYAMHILDLHLACPTVHSYLFVGALESQEHIDHVSWYEDHGGEGHEPAHSLAPAWEHIVSHFERNHLNGAEQEHPLWETWDLLYTS